mmetsp:Transcript_135889/g.235230  ORF Transcript_135889/g.235230 Transcript_135889/m.235230 type:complete len:237 (-) Transcript_135889:34-744(-)
MHPTGRRVHDVDRDGEAFGHQRVLHLDLSLATAHTAYDWSSRLVSGTEGFAIDSDVSLRQRISTAGCENVNLNQWDAKARHLQQRLLSLSAVYSRLVSSCPRQVHLSRTPTITSNEADLLEELRPATDVASDIWLKNLPRCLLKEALEWPESHAQLQLWMGSESSAHGELLLLCSIGSTAVLGPGRRAQLRAGREAVDREVFFALSLPQLHYGLSRKNFLSGRCSARYRDRSLLHV